jgi:hypothetical protein
MFNSIIVRKSLPGVSNVDIGLMAECLIFYEKVYVIADMSMLRSIVEQIGLDILEELINQKHIILAFSPYLTGTHARSEFTPQEVFDYCSFIKVPGKNNEPDFEGLFLEMLEKGSGKRGKSRRVGNRIFGKTQLIEPDKIVPVEKGIPEIARRDLDNNELTKAAIYTAISHFAPNFKFPPTWEFKIIRHQNGFNIFTNLDLNKLNELRSKVYFTDPKSTLTRSYLVDVILKANEDLFLSAYFGAEILTNPVNSSIINLKCKSVIDNTKLNAGQIDLFQEIVLSDAKKIREAINNKTRTFEEILPLLERGKQFKEWLKQKDPNVNLVREYYQAVTKSSWLDKLPGKGVRFSVFTGAGLLLDSLLTGGISTAIGVALGFGDTFLLDKILKGWKPNQYIDQLQKFIEK